MILDTSSQAEKTLTENADGHLAVVRTLPISQPGIDQYTQGQQDWVTLMSSLPRRQLRPFIRTANCTPMFYKWGHSPREPDTSVSGGGGALVILKRKQRNGCMGSDFDFGKIWKVPNPVSSCTIKRVRH